MTDDPAAPSDHPHDAAGDDAQEDRAQAEERQRAAARRRLAEVFGDVLPSTTGDEADPSEDAGSASRRDDELRREVPPHHLP